MAIVNRDLSSSEQVTVVEKGPIEDLGVSAIVMLWKPQYPCTLKNVRYAAEGVSGTPVLQLMRASGAGFTGTAIGISGIVVQESGTSGIVGYSGLAATGSTLLDFSYGDRVWLISSGANSAVDSLVIDLVVKKTQDIVSYNGEVV